MQLVPGIRTDSSRMYFDAEVRQILEDSAYARWVFVRPITMIQFRDALQLNNLRLAFWYAVRLYDDYKPVLLQILSQYDQLIRVDEVLKA